MEVERIESAGGRTIVHTSAGGDRHLSTILRWQHQRGGEAHCLARLYVSAAGREPVAVLSELRTNPPGKGLVRDFAGAAEALLAAVAPVVQVPPETVVWLAHFGTFSTYDTPESDNFTAVDLVWNGDRYEDSIDRYRLLSQAQVDEVLRGLPLRPVPDVLDELQRTDPAT